MKYTETKSGYSHSVEYAYDAQNNLSSQTEIINGTTHNTTYTYDKDNRVTSKVTDNIGVYYTYDSFGRLTQQVTKNNGTVVLTETYTYNAGSAQIASHSTVGTNYSVTYSYTYDDNGNILTVSDGTNTTSYVYDSANQVVRENNQAGNYTYTWTYDNAGNIQSKQAYAYTTGSLDNITPTDTVAYGYTDQQWKDLLTSYDGSNITYDNIGNPAGYGNKTFTWEHGRELSTLTLASLTWTYTYDANGMRTGRVCSNNYFYEYIYDGSLLTQVISTEGTIDFTYDANGKPLTMTKGGATYTYVTNLQGDVIGLLNSNGVQVVTYRYDAWGNCTASASDPIIMYNPLRYRGYVYDKETGLYYLQSRYYDPQIGRFINSDTLFATGQGLRGNNMFAYCLNCPINRVDVQGYISEEAAKNLIRENADAINRAGEEFGVDPVVIAGCIYAEQVINYDWKDTFFDFSLSFLDTSIGLGQVRVSTAMKLENLGYIEKTNPTSHYVVGRPAASMPSFMLVATKLMNNETNIRYVAAYLKAWQDVWKPTLDISRMPGILGTLYNLGQNASFPNKSPRANIFGQFIEDNYNLLSKLLS